MTDVGPDDPGPLRVLFVCTANICRSAALEVMARHAVPDQSQIIFASAGVHGFVDRPLDDVMAAALPKDLDSSQFRSRRLTPALLLEADLVLTAESSHRVRVLDDHPAMFRKVLTLGQAATALPRAPDDLAPHQVIAWLGDNRGPADPALDVKDPFRRGPDAASRCVDRLGELLHAVLPALLSPRGT